MEKLAMMGDMVAEFNQSKVGSYRRNGKLVKGHTRRKSKSLLSVAPKRQRGTYGEVDYKIYEGLGVTAAPAIGAVGGGVLGLKSARLLGRKGLATKAVMGIAGLAVGRVAGDTLANRFIRERAHLRTYPNHFDYDSEMKRKRQEIKESEVSPERMGKMLSNSQKNLARRDRKARRAYGLSERSY